MFLVFFLPPIEAFIITGRPISSTCFFASSKDSIAPLEPGIQGTSAFFEINFASVLSPNDFKTFTEGPIKIIPASSQA